MATSDSTNYSSTATILINGALRLVGAVSQGETPTATQTSEALEALNMMAKSFANKGLPLWAIQRTSFPVTLGTSDYNIGVGQTVDTEKPLKVYQAFRRDAACNIDVPLRIITRQEYESLGNKSVQGTPIQVYYEPLRTYGVAHIYPTPNAASVVNDTIFLINQRPFEDFDAVGDEPDFPQEWFEALKYNLAVRLAGDYGLDMRKKAMLMQEAKMYLDDALAFTQEEGSIYFQPEPRRGW